MVFNQIEKISCEVAQTALSKYAQALLRWANSSIIMNSRKLFTKVKLRVRFLPVLNFEKLNFIFMENTHALVKPKLTDTEKKIINMVVDGLPSENFASRLSASSSGIPHWHESENRTEQSSDSTMCKIFARRPAR